MSELFVSSPSSKDSYYRTINLTNLLDKRLSLQAKALHTYIQTRPKKEEGKPQWKLWTKTLFNFSTNKERSVRAALNELLTHGYLFRIQLRDEKKQIRGNLYVSFSEPITLEQFKNLDVQNLYVQNVDVGFQVYSYNIISYNIVSIVSKDTKVNSANSSKVSNSENRRKIIRKDSIKTDPVIDYWNSKECTTTHKVGTKTYKETTQFLNQLRKGVFSKNKDFDANWLRKYNRLVDMKWTDDQLKKAIDNLIFRFKTDYEPSNKTKVQKSFLPNIYNSYSNYKNSWLIEAYKNPPKLLCDLKLPPKEKNKKVTNKFIKILKDFPGKGGSLDKLEDQLSDKELNELIHGVNDVIEYDDWLADNVFAKEKLYGPARSHLFAEYGETKRTKFNKLADWYIKYLMEERYPTTMIEPYMIGPKSNAGNWHGFLGYLSEVFMNGTKDEAYVFKKSYYKED